MKSLRYIGFLVILSLITRCVHHSDNANPDEEIQKLVFDSTGIELTQVYYDSIHHFTIRYPEDWTLLNNYQDFTLMGAGPLLMEKKSKMTRKGGFGLDITTYDKNYSTEQYYAGNIQTIGKSCPCFEIVEEKTIDMHGTTAKYVAHKCVYNNDSITSIQVYFFRGRQGYIMSGTAFSKEFNEYRDLYLSIASTFELENN